ncbi:MAG: hypothetical protein LH660_08465 [Phormidesmis sp. CAN_BIN36]|nr:hypothetical protein [Phormidesmis sp. CAN_BIN36]
MPKVLIVIEEESDLLGEALKQAVLTQSITPRTLSFSDTEESLSSQNDVAVHCEVKVETIVSLQQKLADGTICLEDILLCPLTLDIPDVEFPQKGVYQDCRDVVKLRQRVEEGLHSSTGEGRLWLPIVLTAKGALYAEAIMLADQDTASNSLSYLQPFHLPDRYRQPLYELGQRLLKLISATPATYLMQFGFMGETVFFDRLFPFPAAPAIASLNVQSPDLFACHWRCLTNTPILDLTIAQVSRHQVFQPSLSDS